MAARRSVGIPRISLRRFAGFRVGILKGDQILFHQPPHGFLIPGHELSFSVADRHGQQAVFSKTCSKDARTFWIGLQLNPTVLVPGGVVMAQGNLPLETLAVQSGQDSQLHQQLKTVADTKYKTAGVDEFPQAVQQRTPGGVGKVQPALRGCLPRPKIIPVKKTAGEHKKLIVAQPDFRGHDIGKMHHIRPVRSGKARGMRRFLMGIGCTDCP